MGLRRFGAKLSLIIVGLLVASLAGFAWVYGSIITLAIGFDDQNKLSVVGFGATILFVFALAKFALINCDGEYD